MKSQLNIIYENLLAGKTVTLEFQSESELKSFYDRLRTTRSRYESKYQDSIGEALSPDKVIRITKHIFKDSIQASIRLDTPQAKKSNFKIISITTNDQDSKQVSGTLESN